MPVKTSENPTRHFLVESTAAVEHHHFFIPNHPKNHPKNHDQHVNMGRSGPGSQGSQRRRSSRRRGGNPALWRLEKGGLSPGKWP